MRTPDPTCDHQWMRVKKKLNGSHVRHCVYCGGGQQVTEDNVGLTSKSNVRRMTQ